jgi:CheY-like chemotaxis protein
VRPTILNTSIPPTTEPNGRHLLLVEDVEDNQVMLSTFLARAGYQVSTCRNGAEALQRHAAGNFAALVMDVHMPVMDGLEATRRIREREMTFNLSRTPIVMLTADIRDESRAECVAAGADFHLVKPVRIARLLELLDRSRPTATASP